MLRTNVSFQTSWKYLVLAEQSFWTNPQNVVKRFFSLRLNSDWDWCFTTPLLLARNVRAIPPAIQMQN